MGCDYYADENGNFTLEIFDYLAETKLGRDLPLGVIRVTGLEPFHKLSKSIKEGESR